MNRISPLDNFEIMVYIVSVSIGIVAGILIANLLVI